MDTLSSTTIAIGGGKGGVGKSVLASNLACGMAASGRRVILVDADLMGANIHTMFGIRYPEFTLGDFMRGRVGTLQEVLIPTPVDGLSLICGAGDLLEVTNPNYVQKQRLLSGFQDLMADYVIIDIGAGASITNLDFFNYSDVGIIVTSPAPTAIQNAYSFLKLAVNRKLLTMFQERGAVSQCLRRLLEGEYRARNMNEVTAAVEAIDREAADEIREFLGRNKYRLVANMATPQEGDQLAHTFGSAAYQFLGVRLPYLGSIVHSQEVERSIRAMSPLLLRPGGETTAAVMKIIQRLMGSISAQSQSAPVKNEAPVAPSAAPKVAPSSASSVQLGLNEELAHGGRTLHVQTEDLGPEKGRILTLVFAEGRILFSRETPYSEITASGDFSQAVSERVRWQQKTIMAGIKAGKLNDRIGG